jgi:hypothetical protein
VPGDYPEPWECEFPGVPGASRVVVGLRFASCRHSASGRPSTLLEIKSFRIDPVTNFRWFTPLPESYPRGSDTASAPRAAETRQHVALDEGTSETVHLCHRHYCGLHNLDVRWLNSQGATSDRHLPDDR